MQIVIEITDRMYEAIKQDHVPIDIGRFIRNGTPLPTVTPKQQTCEDCISRQAAIDCLNADLTIDGKENMETVVDYINGAFKQIKALPSVTPRQKVGKWIENIREDSCGELYSYWACSECGRDVGYNLANIEDVLSEYPYCHCGAKMVELQESEDKE